MTLTPSFLRAVAFCASLTIPVCSAFSQDPEEDDDEDKFILSPFEVVTEPGYYSADTLAGTRLSTTMTGVAGVTPGGAQDISFVRNAMRSGSGFGADDFTAEGLFSEHDLPLGGSSECGDLICVRAEAIPAKILAVPQATHLAQIGFASTIRLDTFKRQPLNLIAVVDKSGSMYGQPLALVKDSLLKCLDHLGPDDRLGIVLYGATSHVYMEPMRATSDNKEKMRVAIHGIESLGSTYMEEGLNVGYELARRTMKDFEGTTRLMLFTDEQPNVGDTSPTGFMGQMRAGSQDGIGLTTIGVGQAFGASLANTVSSVRGGNLFYFGRSDEMVKRFEEDFDMMVSEVAYNMVIRVKPADGMKIEGVFGLPGDLIRWDDSGCMTMEIETLFMSRNKGAIYLAFGGEGDPGDVLAEVSLRYLEAGKERPTSSSIDVRVSKPDLVGQGLTRGVLLVNEYASIQQALKLRDADDDAGAARAMQALSAIWDGVKDESLAREVDLVADMTRTLSHDAGMEYYPINAPEILRTMIGTWSCSLEGLKPKSIILDAIKYNHYGEGPYLIRVVPNGIAEVYDASGNRMLQKFFLIFREGKVFVDWSGNAVALEVEKSGDTLVCRFGDGDGRYVFMPSQQEVHDLSGNERDPVTGLPK